MDVGDIAVQAGLGAAKGYFDSNINKATDERLAKEQQRKIDLLNRREDIQAKYQIDLENVKHKNAMELETVKGGAKKGGYSEKDLNKLDMDIRKSYASYKEDKEAMLETPESYEDYALNKYPRQAELLGISTGQRKSEDDSVAGSFVKNIVNRVKGRGGPSAGEEAMIASYAKGQSSTSIAEMPAKPGGVANASEYDPKRDGYPAPLDMSTIQEDDEGSVKNIKADKKKVLAETQPIVKEAEREISKSGRKGGDKRLRQFIGKYTKAIASKAYDEAKEWAAKLEDRLNELRRNGSK